ncbi:MAG: response regulator [Desulfocapsa sp.]|nr:response regulator [Desulfocapsa sp.]
MRHKRTILLVEDDKVDVMTVKRACRELKLTNPLVVTGNGEEALEYLRNPDNERPCIILLDLNMPKMNGLEFLTVAKKDSELKPIPVIVLTTSHEDQDRIQSFNLGVAGYMLKPVSYQRFIEMVRTIDMYWTLSELPFENEYNGNIS